MPHEYTKEYAASDSDSVANVLKTATQAQVRNALTVLPEQEAAKVIDVGSIPKDKLADAVSDLRSNKPVVVSNYGKKFQALDQVIDALPDTETPSAA